MKRPIANPAMAPDGAEDDHFEPAGAMLKRLSKRAGFEGDG